MRRVIWTDRARQDFFDILHYIAADDPDAAERVTDAIEATGIELGHFATGHPGRAAETYEKSVRGLPWIIAYALIDNDNAVAILRVIHTARDWSDDAWPE